MSCRIIEGLRVVKRSPDYRHLHAELLAAAPSDSWHAGRWGFYVFDLRSNQADTGDSAPRLALFTVNLFDLVLESVKVVTADAARAEAAVTDLRFEGQSLSLPLPVDW